MGLFSKSKNLIGLDIGSSAIKAAELRQVGKGGTYQLVNLGMEPLPPEAIVDGTILDSAMVIESIQSLFGRLRAKTNDVGTSVSGNAVIIKKITLPRMTPEELSESIQWEAEQYIPFDIDDVNLDYQILPAAGEAESDSMDVLLVAAKKDKINDYTSVISQAGKTPVLVDVDAFAVQNCYEVNYGFGEGEVVALVNIGASLMNINIVHNANSIFWRDISIGGNQYTDAVQKELSLSYEQADSLKKGLSVEGVHQENVSPVLDSVSQDICGEIQKTFDFFVATSSCDKVDKIALSGGSSRIPNLDHMLAERFGTPVELINPFTNIEINPKEFDEEELNQISSSVVIAVGLALRRVGDS
jgi:type IV pilus assembly protein PilM